MKDVERRQQANTILSQARRELRLKEKVDLHQQAIDILEGVEDKIIFDYKYLFINAQEIAVVSFNNKYYENAANCYQKAIDYLMVMNQKTDEDYRDITQAYYDCADAYLQLNQPNTAQHFFAEAASMFSNVKNKTNEEAAVGSLEEKGAQYFIDLYEHFEKKSCTQKYRESFLHACHTQMLFKQHKDQSMMQQEQNMMQQLDFNQSSISAPDIPEDICNLLNLLHVSNQTDPEYRSMAANFLSLADFYASQMNIDYMKLAKEYALNVLNSIKFKTYSDHEKIMELQNDFEQVSSAVASMTM